ncbi:MAG: penicillin-binding protein activator [Desulfobacterales bacterium]|nr:penicillin-binding protein activator [Desulfobacterales bacterium]
MILTTSLLYTLSCSPKEKKTISTPVIQPSKTATLPCEAQDKEVARIKHLVMEAQYDRALAMASAIADTPCSPDRYPNALTLIAEIFMAQRKPANAFHFYLRAAEHTQNLSPAAAALATMHVPDIIFEVSNNVPESAQKDLLLLVAQIKADTGNTGQAAILFQETDETTDTVQTPERSRIQEEDIIEDKKAVPGRIGVLLPLTGYYQEGGQRALSAIYMALEEHGPLPGLELMVTDTASDPLRAASSVEEMNRLQVSCIIGPMVTAAAAAAKADSLGIPMIILTQTPGIPETGAYLFRNFITPELQIRTSADFIMSAYGYRNFALLYPEDDYGKIFMETFMRIVPERGGKITDISAYSPGQADFSEQIKPLIKGYRAKDKGGRYKDVSSTQKQKRNKIYRAKIDFDVLFIPDSAQTVSMIAPQLRYHGITPVLLMGTNLWHSDNLLSASQYLQQAVFTNGFYPGKEKTAEFMGKFRDKTGKTPGYIEAAAHDSMSALLSILDSGPIKSRHHMAGKLHALNRYNCLTCPLYFDTRGEPAAPLDIFQVKGKKIVMIRSCSHW